MANLLQPQSPGAECDFSNPEQLAVESPEVDIEQLKQDLKRFKDFMNAHIAQTHNIIFHSNFRVEDVRDLIDDNEDCQFVRIYNARSEDGSFYQVMTPVLSDGTDKQTASVVYVKNCCACKPNCGKGLVDNY